MILNIRIDFPVSTSNGHAVTNETSSEKPNQGPTSRDTSTRVCCCSLNIWEYEVNDCFPSQFGCCARFENTSCHMIWTYVRYKVRCLVEHKYFEWCIVLLIAASSIALVSHTTNLVMICMLPGGVPLQFQIQLGQGNSLSTL